MSSINEKSAEEVHSQNTSAATGGKKKKLFQSDAVEQAAKRQKSEPATAISSETCGGSDNQKVSKKKKRVFSRTDNGALGFASTGNPNLDLFFAGMVRGMPADKLGAMMAQSWSFDPEQTLQIVMNARDCRDGKGEKTVAIEALLWLRAHKPLTYIQNLIYFIELGYFKDLLVIAEKLFNQPKVVLLGEKDLLELELLAEILSADWEKYQNSTNKQKCAISLAAKWAPSEKKSFDNKHKLGSKVAKLLFPNSPVALKEYRNMLSTLRSHLHVVEKLACSNQWDEIDYSHVPAKAHKLLRAAFKKHSPEKYNQYLADVKSNKAKINTKGIQPHELCSVYMHHSSDLDETIELQWKTMVEDIRKKGTFSKTVAVSDVSGSMSGTPMEVSIALGLMIAELCEGAYQNQVITFHETPTWASISDNSHSLFRRVSEIKAIPWGGSTNLHRVFELVLDTAVANDLPPSAIPERIIVISDMQFNEAFQGDQSTVFEAIKRKWNNTNPEYKVPQVVFWNVRPGTVSPVSMGEGGALLLSGYSAELLKSLLDGEDMDMVGLMKKIINVYPVYVDEDEKDKPTEGDNDEEADQE